MKLTLQWDVKELMELNDKVNAVVQIILIDVWNEITNNAKENAPYLTWSLRKSLNNNFNSVSKWFVVVGSPLAYASVREFVNKKNPTRTFYLQRAFTEHMDDISDIIIEDLNFNLKK